MSNSTITQDLNGITFADNKFVVVGGSETGLALTSPDGVSWTQQTSSTTNFLADVTFRLNTFVGVGMCWHYNTI